VNIRNITKKDIEPIARIAQEALNPIYGIGTLEEDIKIAAKMLEMCEPKYSFLAEEDGQVLGFLFARIQKEPYDEFPYGMALAVSPAQWNKGIATHLINKTIETLKQDSWDTFTFHALPENKRALKIYENMGFKTKKLFLSKSI